MLAQVHDGTIQPVAYCSKVFTETQQKWHVSGQGVYAAIYCVEKWSYFLRHQKFTLHTDHKNLQKLFNTAVNFKVVNYLDGLYVFKIIILNVNI